MTSRTCDLPPPGVGGGQLLGKVGAVRQVNVQLDHVTHGGDVDAADDRVHQGRGDVLRRGEAVEGVKGRLDGLQPLLDVEALVLLALQGGEAGSLCFQLLAYILDHAGKILVREVTSHVEVKELFPAQLQLVDGLLHLLHVPRDGGLGLEGLKGLHDALGHVLAGMVEALEQGEQHVFHFRFPDVAGGTGVGAALLFAAAQPGGIGLVAVIGGGGLPVIQRAAMGAVHLAGEQVGVGVLSAVALYIRAALGKDGVGFLPGVLADQGGDVLVRVHDPFFLRQLDLPLVKGVGHGGLAAAEPALVLGVADHLCHGGVVDAPTLGVAVALLPEQLFQLVQAEISGGEGLKQVADEQGFLLVDHQMFVHIIVAVDAAVAEHTALLDGLAAAELHAGGNLAAFVLGDAGHDGEPQLTVRVQGVDAVVHEKHAHVPAQQVAGVGEGINGVAGKTADLLGEDQVEAAFLAVLDHLQKVLTLADAGAADALVDIAWHKRPPFDALDLLGEVGLLVFQGIELLVLVGGHAGIEGDAEGQVVNGAGFELLADESGFHSGSFPHR